MKFRAFRSLPTSREELEKDRVAKEKVVKDNEGDAGLDLTGEGEVNSDEFLFFAEDEPPPDMTTEDAARKERLRAALERDELNRIANEATDRTERIKYAELEADAKRKLDIQRALARQKEEDRQSREDEIAAEMASDAEANKAAVARLSDADKEKTSGERLRDAQKEGERAATVEVVPTARPTPVSTPAPTAPAKPAEPVAGIKDNPPTPQPPGPIQGPLEPPAAPALDDIGMVQQQVANVKAQQDDLAKQKRALDAISNKVGSSDLTPEEQMDVEKDIARRTENIQKAEADLTKNTKALNDSASKTLGIAIQDGDIVQPVRAPLAELGTRVLSNEEFIQQEADRARAAVVFADSIIGSVPVVGTAALWHKMGPVERGVSVALDGVGIIASLRGLKVLGVAGNTEQRAERAISGIVSQELLNTPGFDPDLALQAQRTIAAQKAYARSLGEMDALASAQDIPAGAVTAIRNGDILALPEGLLKEDFDIISRAIERANARKTTLLQEATAYTDQVKAKMPGADSPALRDDIDKWAQQTVSNTRRQAFGALDDLPELAKANAALDKDVSRLSSLGDIAGAQFGRQDYAVTNDLADAAENVRAGVGRVIAASAKQAEEYTKRIASITPELNKATGPEMLALSREQAELRAKVLVLKTGDFKRLDETVKSLEKAVDGFPADPALWTDRMRDIDTELSGLKTARKQSFSQLEELYGPSKTGGEYGPLQGDGGIPGSGTKPRDGGGTAIKDAPTGTKSLPGEKLDATGTKLDIKPTGKPPTGLMGDGEEQPVVIGRIEGVTAPPVRETDTEAESWPTKTDGDDTGEGGEIATTPLPDWLKDAEDDENTETPPEPVKEPEKGDDTDTDTPVVVPQPDIETDKTTKPVGDEDTAKDDPSKVSTEEPDGEPVGSPTEESTDAEGDTTATQDSNTETEIDTPPQSAGTDAGPSATPSTTPTPSTSDTPDDDTAPATTTNKPGNDTDVDTDTKTRGDDPETISFVEPGTDLRTEPSTVPSTATKTATGTTAQAKVRTDTKLDTKALEPDKTRPRLRQTFTLPDGGAAPTGKYPREVTWEQGINRVYLDIDTGARRFERLSQPSTRPSRETLQIVKYDTTPPTPQTFNLGFITMKVGPNSLEYAQIPEKAQRPPRAKVPRMKVRR